MAKKQDIAPIDDKPPVPPEFGKLTDAMQTAFDAIDATYVRFLAQWIRQGWKMPAKAYQIVMPNTDPEIAAARASMILQDENVQIIVTKMKNFAIEDLFLARSVVKDALEAKLVVVNRGFAMETDIVDHAARLKAVEVLNKMSGNNAPEKTENLNKNLSVVVEVQLPAGNPDF